MSEETKRQVLEMCAGIVLHNLILFVICLVWFRDLGTFLGILAGAAAAVAILISIAHSAELCVESANQEYARKKMQFHAVIRSLFWVLAVLFLWKFTPVNILTVALGTLGAKTGAYLYPVVHKIIASKRQP